jgi:hypothetical protein
LRYSRIDECYIIEDIESSEERIWTGPSGGRKQGRKKLVYALATAVNLIGRHVVSA